MLLNMIKNLRVNLKGEEKIGFFPLETGTINLYSQSIENNYWISIQNYQIILNHFKFAWHVKIAIAIQKKKKEKTAKFKRTKKLFFARNEHRKIQLFVFHCFETKVSPNVFNKRSLAECRYLGPRPWPAHYAGHLHSHDFEQVLTTIGKLGGRGPSCVHGRRAKVCEKVNRTRRFSTAPPYNESIVRVSSSWQGVFYCGGLETVVGVAWPLEMENGQGIFMGQGMKSGGVLRIIHLVVGRAS